MVGGKIAFISDRDGNWEIYVMNADGSGQARLTNNPADDLYPSWSPDGTKIAFASKRDGNYDKNTGEGTAEIYVMNADGSGQTRLTNNPADDLDPSWSPDGTKIAFASRRDEIVSPYGRDDNVEIYVMNADGTRQTRLTNNPAGDSYPSWSPDGTKIAFACYRDASFPICVMNADGTRQTPLTNKPANDYDPSWSPDGTKIALFSSRDNNAEIYVMNADGTGQTRLTNNQDIDTNPSWSPDGGKIAFTAYRDTNFDIYVMNADGTGQTRLTNNRAGDVRPSWGPAR